MTIAFLKDRAVLRIGGADARAFLQGLLTNDVALLAPDRPLYAGLLSPQGKSLFDMMLFDGGADQDGAVLIDVAAARAEALAKRLAMYRLRKAVTVEATDLGVIAAWGGDEGGVADPRFAGLGSRSIGAGAGEGAGEGVGVGAGDVVPGAAAYDAHRLLVGVPGSDDIGSDELLWLETGADLLNGVSFTKGCYVGQENTARMHHRDKVRRRLVPVAIEGGMTADVTAGAAVLNAAGLGVGSLRSWRQGFGIAHLRLEAVAGPLSLGGARLGVRRPAWLEPALAAAVGPA